MSDVAHAHLPIAPPDRSWEQRLARAWSAGALPAVLLPMIAIALGPQGLAVISPGVASLLDPAVPVALATIGAMAALQLPIASLRRPWLGIACLLESALTGGAVAAGLYAFAPTVGGLAAGTIWLVAAATAICAAASSPLAAAEPRSSSRPETIIRDVDFLVPAVAGALLLVWLQQPDAGAAALLFGKSIAAAAVVAVAGVLLAAGSSLPGEQRVFGMAILLLIGGVADTLGLSALVSGLCAGAVWRAAGPAVRETIVPVVAYVQHPLLVLMLLVAGMRVQITTPLLALTAGYVLLRLAGKVVGGWVGGAITRRPPSTMAGHLLTPGVFGVALALTFARADAALATSILTIVVVGTAASQLLHALTVPGEPR